MDISPTHIELLRTTFDAVKGINASGGAYKNLVRFLDSLNTKSLKKLVTARIKFVSALAKNRLKKNEMLNKPNYIRNKAPVPQNNPDGEHEFNNPDVVKEDDKEPKFHSVHRTSTFNATFGRWYSNYVPLSTKKIQSILGKEKVSVFHVGNAEYERDIKQVGRIVGKKGTLSTFTSVDKGEKLAKGQGIQSKGGIIYQIEGTLLVASTRDMQSMPDNTGRRWIGVEDLAGKVAGGKMYKELKSAIKKNKMDVRSWDKIEREEEQKWEKENDYWGDYTGGYKGKEEAMKKIMGPIKRKWIKKYIDMGYKIIDKYKPQIKRHILSQKDKPSEHGWNEILVNQIKIKDVFLLKRSDYPNIRKAAEKIATGQVTVGSPAQFRKWYNQRGGIINEVKTNEEITMNIKELVKKTVKEVVAEDKLNMFLEKNVPTNPSKWSYYKSQAKKKFDVYPSAYANGWAAKQYKAAGGGWKKG